MAVDKLVSSRYKNFYRAWINFDLRTSIRCVKPCGVEMGPPPNEEEWQKIHEDTGYEKVEHNYRHPTPSELLEIFPEAIQDIKRNKREWLKKLEIWEPILEMKYDLWWQNFLQNPPPDREFYGHRFWKELYRDIFYYKPLRQIKQHIKTLEHFLRIHEWKQRGAADGSITETDIARAKAHPLTNFVQPNHSGFALCPFHKEKTPSFKIYPDNRWHCFGACEEGGDVIDFFMKQNGIDFVKAVKTLK